MDTIATHSCDNKFVLLMENIRTCTITDKGGMWNGSAIVCTGELVKIITSTDSMTLCSLYLQQYVIIYQIFSMEIFHIHQTHHVLKEVLLPTTAAEG